MIKQKKFSKWITEAVQNIGEGEAYCFNLYEDKRAWTCELISSSVYDSEDSDWVCNEKNVFGREKPLKIAKKREIDDFEEVLILFKDLLENARRDCPELITLSDKKHLAYGFVDGDLYELIPKN